MKKLIAIGAALALLAVLPLSSPAIAGGNISITRTFQPSSADSWLKSGSKNLNSGTGVTMDTNDGPDRDAIVRFDISSIPGGSSVSSASLGLYVTNIADGTDYEYRTIGVHRVLADWAEGTVTWNTPGSTAGVHYASSATASTDIYGSAANENQFYNWTVTTDVSGFVAGTYTDYGWRVNDVGGTAGSGAIEYATKDNATTANRPKLSVTFTAPWDSYQSDYTTVWGDMGYGYNNTHNTVYMKGTGFAATTYNVAFYDGGDFGGQKVTTNTDISLTGGELRTSLVLYEWGSATIGNWHAVAQPTSAPNSFPQNYNDVIAAPDTYGLIASDSFSVEASAIPEFPTTVSAIAVMGLCATGYCWMKRRVH